MTRMAELPQTSKPARIDRRKHVLLAHGGGGQLTEDLLNESVLPRLGNEVLSDLLDAAMVDIPAGRLAMTIDGYVVQPLEFPGGDIGRLAISGTVNDLAVMGAKPLGVALGMILAEGLERSVLERITESIRACAEEASVRVITGDTKVVGRGHADGMYLTTAGIGVAPPGIRLHPDRVRTGDAILINGPIGDHALAVMLAREMPHVGSRLKSDVAPLNGLIAAAMEAADGAIVFMRDATRGGLAGVAADLAARIGLHVVLEEERIQVRPETRHAAEMLGLDVLDAANEGKVVMVCRPDRADLVIEAMRSHPLGRDTARIGSIEAGADGICELHTSIGGRRVVQKPYGEQLPRIC